MLAIGIFIRLSVRLSASMQPFVLELKILLIKLPVCVMNIEHEENIFSGKRTKFSRHNPPDKIPQT